MNSFQNIRYEPCSCSEHRGNMYQRVSCTENKVNNVRIRREAKFYLLLLYKKNTRLNKDICCEIASFF